MTFDNYLLYLISYISLDIRTYIAELLEALKDDDDIDLTVRLFDEAEALKRWRSLETQLLDDPAAAIKLIRADRQIVLTLFNHARDGFAESPQARTLSGCDPDILADGLQGLRCFADDVSLDKSNNNKAS